MSALTRRTALKAGAGGLTALSLAGRSRSLWAATPTPPNVLLVYCSGGWDQSMVFDGKPGSTYVAQEPGAVAATVGKLAFTDNPTRPLTKQFFETYGADAAIVNGVYSGSLDHRGAFLNTFGAVPPGLLRPVDWLTFYASIINPSADMSHTVINAPFMPGESAAYAVRLTDATIAEYAGTVPGDAIGTAGEAALKTFRANSYSNLAAAAQPTSLDAEKLAALSNGFTQEAAVTSAVSTAVATVGAQGADSDFLHNGKIAMELIKQGNAQAITLQAGATDLWDTTANNFAAQTANYEMLFGGLSSIISYAVSRGVGSNLLVVVASELGRAPSLNANAGKGPWPYSSVLLWGAPVNGGTVVGNSDGALRGLPIDPVFGTATGPNAVILTMANVFAGIYLKSGVPVGQILPSTLMPLAGIMKES